jgi:4-oxalocrotonate tautomerase
MPLIKVQVIKDVFSKEQKHQIISKLTDATVSIEGENMRQVTFCLVEEVESGDWGIGGKAMTTANVHALARGKAACASVQPPTASQSHALRVPAQDRPAPSNIR